MNRNARDLRSVALGEFYHHREVFMKTPMQRRCTATHTLARRPSHLAVLLGAALATVTLGFVIALPASAESNAWPQWRGPAGNGVAPAGNYPQKFGLDEDLAWKTELPGKGTSTPAIFGDHIFVTCHIGSQDGIICLGLDGKKQWSRSLGEGGNPMREHRNGSTSNPSPLTDGQQVFAYYLSGTLAALSMEGKEMWKVNLQKKYGEDTLWWMLGSSPVLTHDNVVVAVMQAGNSYLVACDKKTGNIAWKTDRNYPNKKESDQAYTTPQVVTQDGREVIVTWGADHLTAHDAKTGGLIWTCGGFNPEDEAMWRVIASPALSDGIVAIPYGRKNFLAGVKLGGEGDVTETNRLWQRDGLGADCPSPVAADGKLYLLTDRGSLRCLDLKTGEDIWSDQLPRSRKNFFSSPVLAGDLIYCGREDGALFCGRISDRGFELLSTLELGDPIIASPVPLNDKLYVRTTKHLYCFGK